MSDASATDQDAGLDPELAALIGVPDEADADGATGADGSPSFDTLFGGEAADGSGEKSGLLVESTTERFAPIDKFQDDPRPTFAAKDYYKQALSGVGDVAARVHKELSAFLTAKDPKERGLHRERLTTGYGELLDHLAGRLSSAMPEPKRMVLRFGVLSPTLLSREHRDMLSRVVFEHRYREPVYYVDEWLQLIGEGSVRPSAVDEAKAAKKDSDTRGQELIEKRQGQMDAARAQLEGALGQMDALEHQLQEQTNIVLHHEVRAEYGGLKDAFSAGQKAAMSEIGSVLRQLANADREVVSAYGALGRIREDLDELRNKHGDSGGGAVEAAVVANEMLSVRQMAKMAVGRQGNHFPIMMKQYVRPRIEEIGTRENVIALMAEIESVDAGLFHRTFKRQTKRIVPNVILIPSYGDAGICWEPFERFNRATSRGRVAIPMYPKDLRTAVILVLGDLRWQVAKEKAQHHWMEEGLTGWYYQWFESQKTRKGDVRDAFLQDYLLWVTREREGTQKLDKEVRAIFWRLIPFPQDIKDLLKDRGFVYAELYKKDQNRAASDGY